MKNILFCFVTLAIGLSHGRHLEEPLHGHVLKRVARDIMSSGSSFVEFQARILDQCEVNNHADIQDELKTSMLDMMQCFKKKTMFVASKEEFIRHMEQCSQNVIRKTKLCLNDNQKYLPGLLLNIAKSLISFMYDDIDILADLGNCVSKLSEHTPQVKYHQCLIIAASQNKNSEGLPESKEDFCGTFIPAIECFPENMQQYCESSDAVERFSRDYINALRKPCGLNEV